MSHPVSVPHGNVTPLSLRANFSWTFAGQLVYGCCQWGMLAVIAKLGTAEMLGTFSLGLAVTAPIIIFSMLQLRAVEATDAGHEYEFGHYLALRLGTSALALALVVLVTLLAGYRGEAALVILAVGALKAVEAVSDVYHGMMQQRDRMDRIAIALMLKGSLFLTAFTLAIYLSSSVLWGVLALIVCAAAVLLLYERKVASLLLPRSSTRPRWDAKRLIDLTRLAFPLGIVMLLLALNANVPRYFVESLLGVAELGYFTALIYPQTAGIVIISALGQAATPRLARHYAAGERAAFIRLLNKMVWLGAALGAAAVLIAVLFGRQILTLLYQAEYAAHYEVFVWLMLAAGLSFLASFLGYGMTAARMFKAQVPLFAATALIGAAACYLLIPPMGLIGAARASVLVQLAGVIGSAGVLLLGMLRRDEPLRPPAYTAEERETMP